ncbi:Nif3-like dinuclear metal center hexameric protein [Hippea maritima]|uniref:GTP cyclohydrolase 1 type 2 homolog n=1 Tax=Hippea maritima (strain ATCC 700847 / DSM 10411 / MH2) TaxID=760142 RepID=F2LX24_HIPMA|nr:Nif3-like dinuclear metal center hexameric protein [Hippea maritima]AEA34208.1 NGG1p interacting factor 3 protein, NIF3 [Hippea maritima DSM 10411]
MEVTRLIDYLEAYFPLSLQEGWDNSGLQISPQESSIKGVLLSLDVNSQTINEAIKLGCNLIVSHHPLLFSSTKKIFNDFYPYNVLYKAIQKGIGVYAFHTNLDIAEGGLNDYLCNLLELKDIEIIENKRPLRIGRLNRGLDFEVFVDYVKEKLSCDAIKYIKANDRLIKRVAVCSGSCMELVYEILDLDFDVFLSGDLKHHTAIFAKESGINVVDATHYHTEKFSKFILKDIIKRKFRELRVFVSESDYLPWDYR